MTPEEEKKLQIEKDNQEALVEAAEWLGETLNAAGIVYMLNEAASLTVKTAEKGYQKAAHVGGEEFKVVRGYHGKRDGAILVFTPVAASNYTEMELPVTKAECLSGLDDALRKVSWSSRVKQIASDKIKAREELANTERTQAYGNDYGGW